MHEQLPICCNRLSGFCIIFLLQADKASLPLHLKGRKRDVLFFKGMVFLSMVGLAISFGGLYKMANGTMTKKGST